MGMAEKKEEKKVEKKKSISAKTIFEVAFAVINLAVIGWGVFFVYKSTLGWAPPVITEEQLAGEKKKDDENQVDANSGPLIYTMDKFTVNLGGEPKRVIRIEVNLEMLSKDGFEEIVNFDTRVKARDRVVRLLNEKTFAELETIQGKLFLKDKIAMELNGILAKGVVKDIYFSEFVVQ